MILLLSARWPQRALLRAQLAEDTGAEVVAADTADGALRLLADSDFDLFVLDTQGLARDERLVGAVRAAQQPLIVVTGAFDAGWSGCWSELNVRALLIRPVFIGEVSSAACTMLH